MVGVLWKERFTYLDRTGKRIPTPVDYGPKAISFSEGLGAAFNQGKWDSWTGPGNFDQRSLKTPKTSARDWAREVRSADTVWCPADASGNRTGSTRCTAMSTNREAGSFPPAFNSAEPFSEGVAAGQKV